MSDQCPIHNQMWWESEMHNHGSINCVVQRKLIQQGKRCRERFQIPPIIMPVIFMDTMM